MRVIPFKKVISSFSFFCFLLFIPILCMADDFSLSASPAFVLPAGAFSHPVYPGCGFQTDAGIPIDLIEPYNVSFETGLFYMKGKRENIKFLYSVPVQIRIAYGFNILNFNIESGVSTGVHVQWCAGSERETDLLQDNQTVKTGCDPTGGIFISSYYPFNNFLYAGGSCEYRVIAEKSACWQSVIFTLGIKYYFRGEDST